MSHTHHAIDYIEFTVTDMEAAKAFYTAAFGWAFNTYGPEYSGIAGPEREIGGFAVGEVTSGGQLVVLYSDDLDATLAAVTEAGGTIVKPTFSFPGGRRFHFEDPSKNELAVWSTT